MTKDRYEQLEDLRLYLNCQHCNIAHQPAECDKREARTGAVILACPGCHRDLAAFMPQ